MILPPKLTKAVNSLGITSVIIVGGGPAGSSLAIRLAQAGFDVTIIERDRFPRHKLCGEFISPECLMHFADLGVAEAMLARGGDHIIETIFYERGGRGLTVPSEWFGGPFALGLSRSAMDLILLAQARSSGAAVFESTRVTGLIREGGRITGVRARTAEGEIESSADLIIDATGRSAFVAGLSDPNIERRRPDHLGFKVHLRDVALERGRCEIYSFEGGYGGLSYVEDGVANFCFLIKAATARKYGGKAEPLFRRLIRQNSRASAALKNAKPVFDWLAVAIERFGRKEPMLAGNVLTVGDAAGFIDPFTGSGMLLALESAKLLSSVITEYRNEPDTLAATYENWYDQQFTTRLNVSSVLRRAAYSSAMATAVIRGLGLSRSARKMLVQMTRRNSQAQAAAK